MDNTIYLESISSPKLISGSASRAILSQENPQLTPGSNTTDKCVSGGGGQLIKKSPDGPGLCRYIYRQWDQDNEWTDKNGHHIEYVNVRLIGNSCSIDVPVDF